MCLIFVSAEAKVSHVSTYKRHGRGLICDAGHVSDGLPVYLSFFLPCLLRGDPAEACGDRCPHPQADEGESQGALC